MQHSMFHEIDGAMDAEHQQQIQPRTFSYMHRHFPRKLQPHKSVTQRLIRNREATFCAQYASASVRLNFHEFCLRFANFSEIKLSIRRVWLVFAKILRRSLTPSWRVCDAEAKFIPLSGGRACVYFSSQAHCISTSGLFSLLAHADLLRRLSTQQTWCSFFSIWLRNENQSLE